MNCWRCNHVLAVFNNRLELEILKDQREASESVEGLNVMRFEDLSSGDVILYSGKHPLHLRQQEVTGCLWSQVGIVLRSRIYSQLFVVESTKLSVCRDVKTGVIEQGVQIVRLEDRVDSFEGKVAVRLVVPSLSRLAVSQLHFFAEEVHGRPFNDSKLTAARAFRRRNTASDCSSFFCSELVAEAFQRIGLLPTPPIGLSSNNYIPADFSSAFPAAQLSLRKGYCLSAERLVSPPHSKTGNRRRGLIFR